MTEPVATSPAPRRVPALGYADFEPGAVFESYARTVTEADLVAFTQFAGNRLPIFIDDEHARHVGPHGGRIVPGFLTASLSGAMLESILGPDTLAGLGMDGFRFTVPVRPGDTLRVRVTVLERRETRDPARGVVGVRVEVANQRGECALAYRTTVLMGR
ncbi:MAG: MaoC family dehydratase [Burkholderiales bacterium]